MIIIIVIIVIAIFGFLWYVSEKDK
jgi:hypothetical protein